MTIKVFTIPGGHDPKHGYCAKLVQLSDYEDAIVVLNMWKAAFDGIFAQCFSNGMKDAWGRPINSTLLNEAMVETNRLLAKVPK